MSRLRAALSQSFFKRYYHVLEPSSDLGRKLQRIAYLECFRTEGARLFDPRLVPSIIGIANGRICRHRTPPEQGLALQC